MTAEDFRRLALSFPQAAESSHQNHPDFRVDNRIFATLGVPDQHHGMVKLTPEQQQSWMKQAPKVFHPASGAWGLGGSTIVVLAAATEKVLRPALEAAWQNAGRTRR